MNQRELAEDIIAMDIKNARKVLNYQGPVFLTMDKQIIAKMGTYLLEVRTRYCKKCMKKTSHEWVRNRDFHYWRCPECLERYIKAIGIVTPNNYCNKVSNNLEV